MPSLLPAPDLRDSTDLLLRRPRRADAEAVYEQAQDPEMQRWTMVPVPYRRRDAQVFLARAAHGWRSGALATFAVEVDGRYAGAVDLRFGEAAWAEIGYGLSPWARGRGVMTRSVRLVLRWAFTDLDLAGIRWQAHLGNEPSRRVAEACGIRIEGTVRGLILQRGRRVDGWIGSITAADPLA